MASSEPKEWILNMAFNRWQFNRPRFVGKLIEAIRVCAPRTVDEWRAYYLEKVRPEKGKMLGDSMEVHLNEIGRRLFVKISEQMRAEIDSITEEECIAYVWDVVINRTHKGYVAEKTTIYEQLQIRLGMPIKPAPDEIDRKYSVDFYIPVGEKRVGIQIKPTTYQHVPEKHSWHQWMEEAHRKFQERFGGKVFVVFSVREGRNKIIANEEVISQILEEIDRLRREDSGTDSSLPAPQNSL